MENDINITVNDFSKICRLCLKHDRHLKPIFKSESIDQGIAGDHTTASAVPFNQMITTCFGFDVRLLFCKCFFKPIKHTW